MGGWEGGKGCQHGRFLAESGGRGEWREKRDFYPKKKNKKRQKEYRNVEKVKKGKKLKIKKNILGDQIVVAWNTPATSRQHIRHCYFKIPPPFF